MALDPAPPSQSRKRVEQTTWIGRAPLAAFVCKCLPILTPISSGTLQSAVSAFLCSANALSPSVSAVSLPPNPTAVMPPKDSANKAAVALRPPLPRKCKSAISKTSNPRPQSSSKRRGRRAMATAPALPPPGGEANDSAAPSPDDDGWAPWPSDRGLTKDEYKKVVDERLRIFYLGVFEFHTDIHRLYTAGEWKSLESAISMMKYHFVKTVDWDTLDAETQEGLTRWAPKAKEYLETVPGSQSR